MFRVDVARDPRHPRAQPGRGIASAGPLRLRSLSTSSMAGEGTTAHRRLPMAGRERFELSRELYTPYPLSRRVLSATQPPPRMVTDRRSILSARGPFHT